MDSQPIVLFVNHLQESCGVYQFFKRMTKPLIRGNWYYIETNQEWEHDHWLSVLQPQIVVYNFYFSGATMPWLTNSKIASQKNRFKQICLYHEGNIDDKGFDLVLHQNPLNTDTKYFNLPRPIPEYHAYTSTSNVIPTIGTFGFGLGGKGFGRLVDTVVRDFDYAHIRMNIPYAFFGDANGDGARGWANHCRTGLAAHNKPTISLTITHDLLPEPQLLDFLAGNDVNAFLYDDNRGRGISGTLDYALAVYKPIAITKSDQFRHMWDDEMLIENNTLSDIMNGGIGHLFKYHYWWNNTTLINAFNTAFKKVLEK
jgi:hypothetical protein